MRDLQIMAPAGGGEQLVAAVRCGANAVYLGAKGFNARRNAANFGEIDLKNAVSYCHERGCKVFVTVNTLVFDSELIELEREADNIAASGADAVIIQDMATLRLFINKYPTLERYASTQTAVHNLAGAKFLESCGFDSVVLARELSAEEMAKICSDISVKAEAFVHGAHCMSLSGACYMSAMLGGRSGNRGLCAQPCRLDWRCSGNPYALSLKDMSLLSRIGEMVQAGVDTFKIEGRMKRPEYVAAAVTACKNALEGKPYDGETLRAVFSRSGFTDGYITGKLGRDMFGYRTKDDVVGADGVFSDLRQLYKNENPLVPLDMCFDLTSEGGKLQLSDGKHRVTVPVPAPEKAINRPLDGESAKKNLQKCGGTPYYVDTFDAHIAPDLSLSAGQLNSLRRQALEELSSLRSAVVPHEPGDFSWQKPRRHETEGDGALWARFYEAGQITSGDKLQKIILPVCEIDGELIKKYGTKLVAELPALLFPKDEEDTESRLRELKKQGLKELWCGNIYGVDMAKRLGLKLHGGFRLNLLNTEAAEFYDKMGLDSVCVSYELQSAKIEALGGSIPRGAVVYGKLPLMHFRACPRRAFGGCNSCGGKGELVDRKNTRFELECTERKFSALLNSLPLDMADREIKGLDYRLLWFTRESAEEANAVIGRFENAVSAPYPHTAGLYYRKLL
ncbi:MAG: U32 family peptidase [Clostridia bacterium]|nr:U32 family peptidase [Clostridia bacterium]